LNDNEFQFKDNISSKSVIR